jgi:hypothetical protein
VSGAIVAAELLSCDACLSRVAGVAGAASRPLHDAHRVASPTRWSVGAHGLVSVTPDRIADVRASVRLPAGPRARAVDESQQRPGRFATLLLARLRARTRPPLGAISAVLHQRIAACRLELGTTTTGIVVGSIRDGAKPLVSIGLAHSRCDGAGYFPGPRPKLGPDRAPISGALHSP